MEQKTTSTPKRKRVPNSRRNKKIKDKPVEKYPGLWDIIEEKMRNDKENGNAMLLEKYPHILKEVRKKMKEQKLHPWVEEFAGIVKKVKKQD